MYDRLAELQAKIDQAKNDEVQRKLQERLANLEAEKDKNAKNVKEMAEIKKKLAAIEAANKKMEEDKDEQLKQVKQLEDDAKKGKGKEAKAKKAKSQKETSNVVKQPEHGYDSAGVYHDGERDARGEPNPI